MGVVDDIFKQQAFLQERSSKIRQATGRTPYVAHDAADLKRLAKGFDPNLAFKIMAKAQPKKAKAKEDDTVISKQTDEQKLRQDMKVQKEKLAASTHKKSRGFWDEVSDFTKNAIKIGGQGLEYVSRPGQAVTTAYANITGMGISKEEEDEIARRANDSFLGNFGPLGHLLEAGKKGAGAFVGKSEESRTGKDILEEAPGIQGMSGGWQKSAITNIGGLAGDIFGDPTTYVTLGTTSLGAQAGKKALEKVGANTAAKIVEEGLTKSAVKSLSSGARKAAEKQYTEGAGVLAQQVGRRARKVAPGEIDTLMASALNEKIAEKGVWAAAAKKAQPTIDNITGKGVKLTNEAREDIIRTQAYEMLEPWADEVRAYLTAATQRKAQIKILGQDVLRGKVGTAVGKGLYTPLGAVGKVSSKVPAIKGLKQAFQIGEHFPGLTDRIRRVTQGRGVVANEKFARHVDALVKGLSKDDERLILKHLEEHVPLTGKVGANGKDLQPIADEFDAIRKEWFHEQSQAGIYDVVENAGDDWVPHHYRGGSVQAIASQKAGRKAALRSQGSKSIEPYTIAAAKAAKLNPYDRVGDAFKAGHADMQRKLVREQFRAELLDEYGVQTAAKHMAEQQGLVDASDITPKKVREAKMLAEDEGIYMHPEIKKAADHIESLMKMGNNEELNRLLRLITRGTNSWKKGFTVYNPGNWLNNTMGDFVLNFFDGVQNPIWYERAAKILRENVSGGTIKIGGQKFDHATLRKLYDDWASGAGYMTADVARPLGRTSGYVGRAYQKREDFSRMAHFLYSLDDELKRGLKEVPIGGKFKPGINKQLEAAAAKAGDRVAKWNIDYSAFTGTERKIKTNYVPFYAWMRKSMPLMLEAMATKPGRVGAVVKTQRALDEMMGGGPQGEYPDVAYPLWLRDMGFTRLFGGDPENPTVLPNKLPTNVFGSTFGGGSWPEIASGLLSSVHPMFKTPIEFATQKSLFSGGKGPEGLDILTEQIPGAIPTKIALGKDVAKDWKDISISDRLGLLLGNKPYQVNEAAQISELRRQQDPMDYEIQRINKMAEPFAMRKTKKGYQIYNKDTNQTFGTYQDPGDAQRALERKIP